MSNSSPKDLEAIQAIESLMTCDLLSGTTKAHLLDIRDTLLAEIDREGGDMEGEPLDSEVLNNALSGEK